MTNKIVYKWGPVTGDPLFIEGRVVHVGYQGEHNVYVWTEVELDNDIIYNKRYVNIYGNGQHYTGQHLGTVVMPSGLVWHIVEEM